MQVVMYSRPGCHLCDTARQVITAQRARSAFDFVEIDISREDALEREYGIRIPVIQIDGTDRFEIEVDAAEFARLVGSSAPRL